jgi:argininosuccinate lyase
MSGRARDNFSTATELADSLVRQFDMPFRIAHMIVAKVVSNAVGAGIRSDHITPEMVDEAAVSVIGRPLGLSREMLKQVMDPDLNMRIRSSLGGPAPTEVRAMLADDSRHLDEYRARTCARKKGLFDAGKRLDSEVSVLSM